MTSKNVVVYRGIKCGLKPRHSTLEVSKLEMRQSAPKQHLHSQQSNIRFTFTIRGNLFGQ